MPEMTATYTLHYSERTDIKPAARPFFFETKQRNNIAILVHGYSSSPHEMIELGRFLAEKGVSARGVLMAGHGGSYEDFAGATSADWWQSVRDEIERAEKEYQNIFLVGYSFGANIVLDIVARHPKVARGVICMGTSLYLRRMKFIKFLYYFHSLYAESGNKRKIPKSRRALYENEGGHIRLPLCSFKQFLDFMQKITLKELEQITTPILLIHSRDDEISSPKSSEVIFERIGSQDKELFILNEFEHNPLNSRNRDVIFDKILSFIEGHS